MSLPQPDPPPRSNNKNLQMILGCFGCLMTGFIGFLIFSVLVTIIVPRLVLD
jgi:hypothetical protein